MTPNNYMSRAVRGFYGAIYLCGNKLFKMIWLLYLFHLFIIKDEILSINISRRGLNNRIEKHFLCDCPHPF